VFHDANHLRLHLNQRNYLSLYFILDVEADALKNPQRIWCIVAKNIETGEVHVFDGPTLKQDFIKFSGSVTGYIGHNLIGWDRGTIRDVLGYDIRSQVKADTLVLSKVLKFNMEDGHSLESWGSRLKFAKGAFTDFSRYSSEMLSYCKQDVELTHKLYNYLMKKLDRPEFKQAIDVEHEMAWICQGMHEDGFKFDYEQARLLHDELTERLTKLDNELLSAFPAKAVFIREITPRLTKYGTISRANLPRDWTDLTELAADCPFSLVKWEPFSASSVKQCIDRLWDAGWSPTDKTKGHLECENTKEKERLEHFKKYGWKLNEINIATLPDYSSLDNLLKNQWIKLNTTDITITKILRKAAKETEINTIKINSIGETTISKRIMELTVQSIIDCFLCNKEDVESAVEQIFNLWSIIATPTGMYVDCSATGAMETWVGLSFIEKAQHRISKLKAAHRLVERLLLAGRHRTLEEWFKHYDQHTGCVHGTFNHIGTWTGRMSHTAPNLGNIATAKSIKYRSSHLQAEAVALGSRMRSFWTCDKEDPSSYLVGTDAVGIQLRIFAHYINDPLFTEALINGSSKDGTDAHTINANLLGCNRDTAKTFIYAFLLGAGDSKLGEILQGSSRLGRQAKKDFIAAYPGLYELKTRVVPKDARRGFFQTFDGRLIVCDSEHLMMAGYLQAGEMCIMKHANVLWRQWADQQGIRYTQHNFIHDEWQTSIRDGEDGARLLGELQCKAIHEVGARFNLNCPMAGETRYGKDWYETH